MSRRPTPFFGVEPAQSELCERLMGIEDLWKDPSLTDRHAVGHLPANGRHSIARLPGGRQEITCGYTGRPKGR